MNIDNRKAIQRKLGFVGDDVDGYWGPLSIARCQKHLRSLMPTPSPWPKSDQKSLTAFYGLPGDETKLDRIPVAGLGIYYDGEECKTITCHKKVGPSLLRILETISDSPYSSVLSFYAGVYANRPMRGGSTPSLHARAAAIDLDPANNGNKTHWPMMSSMPLAVMEFFSLEGWLSAGAFWSRDAMHFQATQ